MGLNIQKGLEGLSRGLGDLYNHSIYKDEVARLERLDAAQQQFQNWQMKMQEEQFGFTKEQAGLEADFRETQTEFMNTVTERQLEQGDRRVDIAEEGLDIQRQTVEGRMQNEDRQLDILERTQQWREEQAERQAEIQQAENKVEIYTSTMESTRQRAQELRDAMREEIGNAAVSPEAQSERQTLIEDELTQLEIEETRAALAAGVIELERFMPEDQKTIEAIQGRLNSDLAEAIVAFNDGQYTGMDPETSQQRVDEGRAAGIDPMAGGEPQRDAGGLGGRGDVEEDLGGGEPFAKKAGQFTGDALSAAGEQIKDPYYWLNQIRSMFMFDAPFQLAEDAQQASEAGGQFIEGFQE